MMLPQHVIVNELDTENYPNRTYKINWETKHIADYIDGQDAVNQAINLHLSTERYVWKIYSWQYGSELDKLIGKPIDFVIIEAPRMIKDALSVDDRIKDISGFKFKVKGHDIHCTFTVKTLENIKQMEIDFNA